MKYTPDQLKAINTIGDNLQIIACAGSGKTQVISQRIVNILKSEHGTQPQNIVAFTYTEKAAAELKTRVLKLCKEQLPGMKGLVDMYIGTIHSWCLKVLQGHIYEYQKFSVLDDIKLKLFIDRNFNRIGMKDLNMEVYKDTGHFSQLMTIVRESELTTPSDEIPEDIQNAVTSYEQTLINAAYFDFTMIMTKALDHLRKDNIFSNKIGGALKYLIVDEYQDVNPVQELIINSLVKLGANICVVGDDDQTIYQWRGGDIKYIIEFQERYNNVKPIRLVDNFRSSPAIIEIATKVITNNTYRLPKQMEAKSTQVYEQGDILYNAYDNVDDENQFIADQIKKLRGIEFTDKGKTRGLDYSDFCILLRKWKKAENIIKKLEENNIPFIVGGVNELFARPEVRASIQLFNYLNDLTDQSVIIDSWCSLSNAIATDKVEKGIEYLNMMKPHRIKYYGDFVLQEIFQTFLEKSEITEEKFVDDGSGTRVGNKNEEVIFYNLGMFSRVIDDFETIHFMSQPGNKLRNFLNFIRYSAEHVYAEGWLNNNFKTPNAVQIMTVYQSKGLEFPAVFIPGMNRNYLPTSKMGGKSVWHHLPKTLIQGQQRYEGGIEDERRLLYVAITRSQKFLFISRAPDGKMQGKESSFVAEFSRSSYIFSNKNRDYTDRKFTTPKPRSESSSILLNFSVLKNYFDCPYRFKLISMYGFASLISIRMGFGKSVHNILMEIHKNALDGLETNLAHLPELLNTHVHIPYAYDDIKQDIKDKSAEIIKEYLRLNQEDFKNIEFAEKDIQIDLGDGILINGRVDLIKKKDINGDIKTTIIDFKSAEDAQKYDVSMEQLSLYAIGYQELSGEKADFLQVYNMDKNYPDTKEIQIDDLDAMKLKIVSAADSIRQNDLPKTKNYKNCKECRLVRVCSMVAI
jgi:DNA helicase-2/ATP-dependent DNA helicase PcrA